MRKKEVIGIDLGTTYSEMAHVTKSGAVEVIPNSDGDLKTPSVASVASGKVVIGKAAWSGFVVGRVARNHKDAGADDAADPQTG